MSIALSACLIAIYLLSTDAFRILTQQPISRDPIFVLNMGTDYTDELLKTAASIASPGKSLHLSDDLFV